MSSAEQLPPLCHRIHEYARGGDVPNFTTVSQNSMVWTTQSDIIAAAGVDLYILDSQLGGCLQAGCSNMSFYGQSGDLMVRGNTIIGAGSGTGIYVGSGIATTIDANTIGNIATAISIGGHTTDFNIMNNFVGKSAWRSNKIGIYIGSGSDYYNISGNNCHGASITISDNGGPHKSVQSGGTC